MKLLVAHVGYPSIQPAKSWGLGLMMLVQLIFAGIVPTTAWAQTSAQAVLIPYLDVNGRFGYVDSSRVMRIASQFDDAKPFSLGVAAVKRGGLWGYIDESGAWKVMPRFTGVDGDSDGYSVAHTDVGRVGVGELRQASAHDGSGPNYDNIFHFSLTLRDSRVDHFCIGSDGTIVKVPMVGPGCRWAVRAKPDEMPPKEPHEVGATSPQVAVKFVRDGGEFRWAVGDAAGHPLTPYLFTGFPDLSTRNNDIGFLLNDAGLALVTCYAGGAKKGVVNSHGEQVVPCRFDRLVAAAQDGKFVAFIAERDDIDVDGHDETMILNADGSLRRTLVGSANADQDHLLRDRYVHLLMNDRKSGQYFPAAYDVLRDELLEPARFHLARDDLRNVNELDGAGAPDSPLSVETEAEGFCFYSSHLERMGCYKGSLKSIGNRRYRACAEGLCGLLNHEGKVVIPLRYGDNQFTFDVNGLAYVARDGQHFYMDEEGREFRATPGIATTHAVSARAH